MPINLSELILNADGSIYHLGLLPEDIAPTVITVGDPDRVAMISKFFDKIDRRVQKREFVSHIGWIGNAQLTVISSGIGTDNIDILINEVDTLVNVDLTSRQIKSEKTCLNIVRLGTSGTISNIVQIDDLVLSYGVIGLDGLMHFYDRQESDMDRLLLDWDIAWPIKPYYEKGSTELMKAFESIGTPGITVTNTGFYGPQSRTIRLKPKNPELFYQLADKHIDNIPVVNLEMETSGIYGIGNALGHRCLSINAILAHRLLGEFSPNPKKTVEKMIERALPLIMTL